MEGQCFMKIKTGLDNRRVALNIIFGCIAYGTNAFISLVITPYITSKLGAEAYGFVKLANDFASYGSLVTLALNSMASRFIMLKNEQGDKEAARSYYTSITIANVILSLVLLLPTILIVLGINTIFNVPVEMIQDVRWAFIWTLSNFLICLAGATFGNCFFIKNRLDVSSILTSITSILRAIFIICAFMLVGPKISVMAFGSIIVTAVFLPCNIYFHKKLTPELYFDKKTFDIYKVLEVLSSGIWNSITKLSQILMTGLDLTITNLLLGALKMGYLSVAKTIPNFVSSLINAIGNSFTPNMMKIYANGDKEGLKTAVKTSMRIMTIFATVPNAILISLGVEFYRLWVPGQPIQLINVLSIITVIGTCVLGPMQPIYQIFTLTNKIRQSSIIFIIEGIMSILITIFSVKSLGGGLYAVAGVSVILEIVVALTYHLPVGASYIDLPWYTFFPEIGKTIIILVMQCIIGKVVSFVNPVGNLWINWIIDGMAIGILGMTITLFFVLNKEERNELIGIICNKIIRKIKWKK